MTLNIEEFCQKLNQISGCGKIMQDEMMKNHTTFKTGGPADIFVVPENAQAVKEIVDLCKEQNINYFVMGRGSNLLVGDKGYRGVIICINNTMNEIDINQGEDYAEVSAGAGVTLTKLAMTVANNGLSGFEFAAGIPGTLGGAVAMNAGAYGGEIKDCITQAVVIDDEGNLRTLDASQLQLGYRSSVVKSKGYIVVSATFRFGKKDKNEILKQIEELNGRRRDKQPLEYPSAGSTFKRPEGYFAGKLIQDSGLAGYRVNGASVSKKHCGFVINDKEATSDDILNLINDVKERVEKNTGIKLETEVMIIGEF